MYLQSYDQVIYNMVLERYRCSAHHNNFEDGEFISESDKENFNKEDKINCFL